MLASCDYHFPKSPPTSRGTRQVGFCVGAHGADGSGWLPAESPSAANHLADGEDTLLSARLPGFSTARKRPGAAATVFLQPMAEEPIGTFRCSRRAGMVEAANQRPTAFLSLEERDGTALRFFKRQASQCDE